MKRFIIIMALMGAFAFLVNAQVNESEKRAAQADKNPNDGKLQLRAADAFLKDTLGYTRNDERALYYANRALEVANKQTVLTDTLKGLSCYTLSLIYLNRQDYEKMFEYSQMAMDAFEQELGKCDPVTNGTKLVFATLLMNYAPYRAFPYIQEAFYYNSIAPDDKKITNMEEANVALEFALEELIASYTDMFRYAVPLVWYKGKKYLVLQTRDWNMEKPLIGWSVPSLMRSDEETATFDGDDVILFDGDEEWITLTGDDRKTLQLQYNFNHAPSDPRKLKTNENDSRIWFLNKSYYDDFLQKFRAYKASKK